MAGGTPDNGRRAPSDGRDMMLFNLDSVPVSPDAEPHKPKPRVKTEHNASGESPVIEPELPRMPSRNSGRWKRLASRALELARRHTRIVLDGAEKFVARARRGAGLFITNLSWPDFKLRRNLPGVCTGLALLVGYAAFCAMSVREPVITHRHEFYTMGTRAIFEIRGRKCDCLGATAAAVGAFNRVIAACNLRDPDSELSRLNASAYAEPFACSDLLWNILMEARAAHKESDGAFDITVRPLMTLWRDAIKRNETPSYFAIRRARRAVGLDKVEFDETAQTVRFKAEGMSIDLDGIAKGYALDIAGDAMRANGISRGILNLGGNLLLLEPVDERDESFNIRIRDPQHRGEILSTSIDCPSFCGVSTSGNYERYILINGRKYAHIIDPRSGYPIPFGRATTMVSPSACTADWKSTALAVEPDLHMRFSATDYYVLSYGK